jgi:hypothetical protein
MATSESVESSYTGKRLFLPLIEEADKSRDRLRSALLMNHHTLEVDLKDLIAWNDELAQKVQEHPGEMVPLVSWRSRRILAHS